MLLNFEFKSLMYFVVALLRKISEKECVGVSLILLDIIERKYCRFKVVSKGKINFNNYLIIMLDPHSEPYGLSQICLSV